MSRMPQVPNPRPRQGGRPSSQVGSVAGSTSGASSTTAVPPPSLLTTLTKPTTEGYPATEVIKFLVEVVGRDVVSFGRNAQVSYILVDRAREICDAINIHIKKTEHGTGIDSDWASFAKFSDAIDPAEDALFQLTAYTDDEKTRHLFKGDAVQDCITSADHWVTNREGIWTALNLLETATELSDLFSDVDVLSRQTEREEARTHDDKTFFEEVIEEIDRAFSSIPNLKVPPIVLKMLENLRDLLGKISTGAISPGLTVFALKTGLLVQGVTKLAFHTSTLEKDTVVHLRSSIIWETASQLVELLNTIRDDGTTRSLEKVRRKYDEFLKLLHDAKDMSVPKSYIELLKVAGQVRRPFHSQAVALISLCRTLVTEFSATKNHTPDNLVYLEEALNVTRDGLIEAVNAITELKIFNLDDFEDHPANQTLEKAHALIKKCHDRFELGDWSKWAQFIADAIRKDKERMSQLNKLLNRPSHTLQKRVDQIELTVYVESSSRVVHQTTLSVEGSTRMSAVRWTVAGALDESLRRRVRQRGVFMLLSDDTACDLHEAVSQFAGSGRKCTFRLTI